MEANELMIGDWVECTYWTPSKQLKVAEIRRIMDDEIKIGVYSDDLVLIFKQSEVKPIPLTPEILEKNGFRIIFEGELHTTYFQDIDGFAVEIKIDCIDFTKLSMSNGLGYRVATECKYVHQLQHALRLCEINKTIEL